MSSCRMLSLHQIPPGPFRFAVSGVEIEGADGSLYDNVYGVDVQYVNYPMYQSLCYVFRFSNFVAHLSHDKFLQVPVCENYRS